MNIGVKILDLQTGRIHEYGADGHDSLYVSQDGRYLTYYNLQNGDGSGLGDYRFVCDDNKIPAESETAEALHADVFFNIGGFKERPQSECVDINKLRLMTVEECAGHTIDYAMGWKACVEWIKKGGAK